MKKIFLFMNLILLQLVIVKCSGEKNTVTHSDIDSIYVATWNVENLFDTTDDPEVNDEEYTPEGDKQWDQEKLDKKFNHLSQVILYMNNGKGPDLLGIQEVENQELLDSLNNRYLYENKYKIAYGKSLDKRGIDVGLFYNSNLFDLLTFDTLKVNLPDGWLTRYILYVKLQFKKSGKTLNVFVNHWPSRSNGQEKSEPNRIAAANVLKSFSENLLSEDKNANIIIMGDFNDDPNNKSVSEVLNAKEIDCDKPGENKLFNTSFELFNRGNGTYLYRKNWNMLDQIIISKSLLANPDLYFVCNSFEIIKPEFMINKEGPYTGSAERTYGGKNYIGGYSDHYPVGVYFRYSK